MRNTSSLVDGRGRAGQAERQAVLRHLAATAGVERLPTAWVDNLEVQGEHVYEVGPSGVLVDVV